MATVTITGYLTDIGLGALTGAMPRMTVQPVTAAYGPDGLVSEIPVEVDVWLSGKFSMHLIPSGELTPAMGGSAGVDYIIKVGRFETADDGSTVFHGADVWRFTATAAGGEIGDMAGGSLLAVWIGPPIGQWPSEPLPKGLYLDPITGDGFIES